MIEKQYSEVTDGVLYEICKIIYSPDDEDVNPRIESLLKNGYYFHSEKEYRNGSISQYHAIYKRRHKNQFLKR